MLPFLLANVYGEKQGKREGEENLASGGIKQFKDPTNYLTAIFKSVNYGDKERLIRKTTGY